MALHDELQGTEMEGVAEARIGNDVAAGRFGMTEGGLRPEGQYLNPPFFVGEIKDMIQRPPFGSSLCSLSLRH